MGDIKNYGKSNRDKLLNLAKQTKGADYTRLLESSGVIETSTPIVACEPKDFAMSKEDIAALESVISRIDLVYVSGL